MSCFGDLRVSYTPKPVHTIDSTWEGSGTLGLMGLRGLFRPRTEKLIVGSGNCTSLVKGVHKQINLVTDALDRAGLDNVPARGMLC